ncbi:MAG: flagellar hook-length control protein FliK [Defluviitaleaceae bacterium]|nr:flagellar hook-length control protein FliK [Defluviitaleaceae bacterium]MCL2836767.1 flagellar hook-length control protein FliK [Defluviitaleaceae bacterium]
MNIADIIQTTNKLPQQQPDYNNKTASKTTLRGDVRSMSDLSPGDRFRAGIVNITPSGMTLKLSGGDVISAKTLNSPDARIGDTVIFQVVESFKGQILLEMVKPGDTGGGSIISDGVAREALQAADMPLTAGNMKLVMDLAQSGMPITSNTLHTAAFFMYCCPDFKPTFQQIKFLMDEGFPTDGKTLETFRALLDKTVSLNKNIGELLDFISKLPNSTRNELLRLLAQTGEEGINKDNTPFLKTGASAGDTGNINQAEGRLTLIEPLPFIMRKDNPVDKAGDNYEQRAVSHPDEQAARSLFDEVKSKLYIDLNNDGLNNIGKFYKELDAVTARLSEFIKANMSGEQSSHLQRSLTDIRNNLEFMNQITETKEYLQIPFFTGQNTNGAELHVYRNKSGKKPGKTGNSALVALDYPELGHVQVYIQRTGSRVQLQFRAETSKILNIIASETYKLNGALSGKGFTVAGLSFKRLNSRPEAHTVPEDQQSGGEGITKYSVDMRV